MDSGSFISKRFIALVLLAATLGIMTNIMVNSPQLQKSWTVHLNTHQHNRPEKNTTTASANFSGDGAQSATTKSLENATDEHDSDAHSAAAHSHDGSADAVASSATTSRIGNGNAWEFAWDQSTVLAQNIDNSVDRGEDQLLAGVQEISTSLQKSKASSSSASESCAFATNQMKLSKFDYTHRKKRKGELTNDEMFAAVTKEAETLRGMAAGGGGVYGFHTVLSPPLAAALNHYPPAFSNTVKLETPFGSWKASFHAVPEDLHDQHGKEQPSKALQLYKSPQLITNQPPAYVAAFANSVISSGHLITCRGRVLSSGGCLWEFRRPAAPVETLKNVPVGVALCDEWCKGYYHFTHEHLPRIAMVYRLLESRNDSYLVLSHSPNSFQLQFFTDILGISRDRIVHGKAIKADVGVYPMPMRCGNTFTHVLYMIRNLVWRKLGLETDSFSNGEKRHHAKKIKFLFAERRKLSRMPTNYYALKDHIKQDFGDICDFETTVGETSASVQVKLFHDSDVVLGPHGANIANMMWMRHGTHVIEMASAKKGNMCYYTTASRVNVTHQLLLHDQGKDAKYLVEYEELKAHISHALKSVKRKFGLGGVGKID